ncbi:MAG: TrmH family RNA methyltransferase [Acidimicrobiia bacterium]
MGLAGYGSRVEGLHAVSAAAAAGRVETLYVEEGRRHRAVIRELVDSVGESRVRLVDDVRALAETTAPQGVVADCRPIVAVTLDSLAGPGAAVMVLDHIEDPHNLGAVARSVRAAGLTGMVVSGRRAAPLSAAAFKAAAGALERLPVSVVGSIPEALRRLKKSGLWVVGLQADAGENLFGLELLTEPVAVVVGAEGSGLSRLVAERCDVLVSIPMVKGSESLNASVTAALAAFEIMRVRTPG